MGEDQGLHTEELELKELCPAATAGVLCDQPQGAVPSTFLLRAEDDKGDPVVAQQLLRVAVCMRVRVCVGVCDGSAGPAPVCSMLGPRLKDHPTAGDVDTHRPEAGAGGRGVARKLYSDGAGISVTQACRCHGAMVGNES